MSINSITVANIFLAFACVCFGTCPGDSGAAWHESGGAGPVERGLSGRLEPGLSLILKEMAANWNFNLQAGVGHGERHH